MEPTISLTGEIVLEKGGPGSGPRPGQGQRTGGEKPIGPSGWSHDSDWAGGVAISHNGKDVAYLQPGDEANQFEADQEHLNSDKEYQDYMDQYGVLEENGGFDVKKSISLNGEILLEKGGPGSGPRPGQGQ